MILGELISKGKKFVINGDYRKLFLASRGFYNNLGDKEFLKKIFKASMGHSLNIENPQTFNEKLQWLKLYNRNPEYTKMVDKYQVKKYVSDRIGDEYVIPTLGVWDKAEDIEWDELPDKFVLKATHDSGGLVICRDKKNLDKKTAINKLNKSLKRDYYLLYREWPYKNVPRRIIAEKYMADDLRDYKIFCFNGKPRMTLVCSERFINDGLKEDFYDEAWNHLNIQRPTHGNAKMPIDKPKQYELMKELAARLSEKIPFSRIDFYEINEKVYFGEITFYPASGFEGFRPEEWDLKLGEWIELPK